jgi:DNA-binding CsgD family transcriptional regulator
VILGRDGESAAVRALLERARAGRGGALVLHGEAGIGKTTLLRVARSAADGMTILATRGFESEPELPYAALADLLRPVLALLGEIAPPQAAALRGALALESSPPRDRFAVCSAAHALVAAAAAAAPTLVLVDDLQWVDEASRDALLFLARRLDEDSVGVLVAVRVDGDEAPVDDLPALHVGGLALEAACALVERAAPGTSAAVAEELHAATGGNPLALLEIAVALADGERGSGETPAHPIRLGATLGDVFARRVSSVAEPVRQALAVAAAADGVDAAVVSEALAALGIDALSLQAAEDAGLVALGARVEFRHPLVRAAAYHGVAPQARRAAHAALAAALAAEPLRRAWHLADASVGCSEPVAAELEAVATLSRGRSGYAAAAAALERAAELTPDATARARRLVAAADDRRLSGAGNRACELAAAALELTEDALVRADAQHVRGQVHLYGAPTRPAFRLLVEEAERVRPHDPVRATVMLADAALAALGGEEAAGAVEAARRVLADVEAGGVQLPPEVSLTLLELVAAVEGEPLDGARRERWQALLALAGDPAAADRLLRVAEGASYAGAYADAFELLQRIIDGARDRGAVGVVARALSQRVLLGHRTARWERARADAQEAIALAEAAQRPRVAVQALSYLVRVEAALGLQDECRAHARDAFARAEAVGVPSVAGWHANVGLGTLELGLGRAEEAVLYFERVVGDIAAGPIVDGVFRVMPDLAEAYMHAGLATKAGLLACEFERRAQDSKYEWALATSARLRGLLAPDGDIDAVFDDAMRHHDRIDDAYERARTELCRGQRLRRAGRRLEARKHLRSALAAFERLGARAWAERARVELGASVESARRGERAAADGLTPQELQVALAVAAGASNKEAAAKLFLSPKTIEFHLGHVYRKLGVRSRSELAGRLAAVR